MQPGALPGVQLHRTSQRSPALSKHSRPQLLPEQQLRQQPGLQVKRRGGQLRMHRGRHYRLLRCVCNAYLYFLHSPHTVPQTTITASVIKQSLHWTGWHAAVVHACTNGVGGESLAARMS
jgi:hypothetical protein